MKAKHPAAFTVHLHRIGPGGLARPSLFFDCFQDAASEQSAQLGFSIRDRHRRGPQLGLAAPRGYVVTDADHETILLARGIFFLLDRSANRPVSPDKHLPVYPVADDPAFAVNLPKRPEISAAEFSVPVHIRRDDLDLNHHVNHTQYIGFAMERVPPSIAQSHILELIDVVFKALTRHGDTLSSLIKAADGQPLTFIHRLTDDQRYRTHTSLVTRWRATS